jgi:hypothetical protein
MFVLGGGSEASWLVLVAVQHAQVDLPQQLWADLVSVESCVIYQMRAFL